MYDIRTFSATQLAVIGDIHVPNGEDLGIFMGYDVGEEETETVERALGYLIFIASLGGRAFLDMKQIFPGRVPRFCNSVIDICNL